MNHSVYRSLFVGLLALVLATLQGCASLGKDFDQEVVEQLVVDQTKRSQVRELMGDPWRVGKENGLDTWTYGYYKYGVFRTAFAKDLVLKFDQQGVLRSYSFNTTAVSE